MLRASDFSPTLLTSLYRYFSYTMLSIVVEPYLSVLAADCLYLKDCYTLLYLKHNKSFQQLKEFYFDSSQYVYRSPQLNF